MTRAELCALLMARRDNDVRVVVPVEGRELPWAADVVEVRYDPDRDEIQVVVEEWLVPAHDAATLVEVARECGVVDELAGLLGALGGTAG